MKMRLLASLERALKFPTLASSLMGCAIKHIGTTSNPPISAVEKLITDMRHKPMNAAEIVTDFKIAHSPT